MSIDRRSPAFLRIAISLVATAILAVTGSAFADAPASKKGPDGKMHPPVAKTCSRRDGTGVCREWDYTYAINGVKCTENCLHFAVTDDCKVRNQCAFDAKSGCFKKKTCEKIGTLDDCASWQQDVLCAGDPEPVSKVKLN